MLYSSSLRFGVTASLIAGSALMMAAPASAATVDLSTVKTAPTHIGYYDLGVANGDPRPQKTITDTYYFDFLFGKTARPLTVKFEPFNLILDPYVDISPFTAKLYNITTGTAVLVASVAGNYNVLIGNKYSVTVTGKSTGTLGGHYTLGISLVNPVPGPAGIIVALAGAGLIFGRRWKFKGRSTEAAFAAA